MGGSEFNPNTDRSVQCAGAVLAMSMKSPPPPRGVTPNFARCLSVRCSLCAMFSLRNVCTPVSLDCEKRRGGKGQVPQLH